MFMRLAQEIKLCDLPVVDIVTVLFLILGKALVYSFRTFLNASSMIELAYLSVESSNEFKILVL